VASVLEVPYLLGATHLDQERRWEPAELALFLKEREDRVLGLDPRNPEQARRALARLVELVCEEGGVRCR